jgi:hypothetical protein
MELDVSKPTNTKNKYNDAFHKKNVKNDAEH